MKVKDLLVALQGVDPEREVWFSVDSEGNRYRFVYDVDPACAFDPAEGQAVHPLDVDDYEDLSTVVMLWP